MRAALEQHATALMFLWKTNQVKWTNFVFLFDVTRNKLLFTAVNYATYPFYTFIQHLYTTRTTTCHHYLISTLSHLLPNFHPLLISTHYSIPLIISFILNANISSICHSMPIPECDAKGKHWIYIWITYMQHAKIHILATTHITSKPAVS